MDKEQTLKVMTRWCEQYLEKYGTDGWGDFEKFMQDKNIKAGWIYLARKGIEDRKRKRFV